MSEAVKSNCVVTVFVETFGDEPWGRVFASFKSNEEARAALDALTNAPTDRNHRIGNVVIDMKRFMFARIED